MYLDVRNVCVCIYGKVKMCVWNGEMVVLRIESICVRLCLVLFRIN